MAPKSSYLQYLPPVLWADEPEDPAFSLGGLLRIFEKVLTGIDDDVVTTRPPLTTTIARVPRLFDPWEVPDEFLSWLAGFVDLRFPTLQGVPVWSRHQQRTVVAQIAGTYPLRGQKSGLARYLELHAVGGLRPRIALDDGSRILTATPVTGGPAAVAAMVTQGPVIDAATTGEGAVLADGVVRPNCVAVGADGDLFVGDLGVLPTLPLPKGSQVWGLGADGHHGLGREITSPEPVVPRSGDARQVVAVAVRPARSGLTQTLFVLDAFGRLSAVPSPAPGAPGERVAELAAGNPAFTPTAMCLDRNGDLLVLDRGSGPGTAHPPRLVTVAAGTAQVSRRALERVVHPLSLAVLPDGDLIVGDGGAQEPTGPEQFTGTLVRVDRSDPAQWRESVLLPADRTVNPLVSPTAVCLGDDGLLYVLDVGLKPLIPPSNPFILPVADPAGVYRVDVGPDVPTVERITEPGLLVYPTGMAARAGRLVICDPGMPPYFGEPARWSRMLPHRFELVVHFTDSRLPPEGLRRTEVLNHTVLAIEAMVDEQKPAHTYWTPVTTS